MVKFLAGASLVCITMVLAGVNRGFDISDEGLYVLLADPHQPNVAGIFNYDLFFKLIFKATGYSFSLVELRIIRLLAYFAGAWALTGFWRNVKSETGFSWDVFWVSFLGLLGAYAFLPPTLSYNSLTVVLICIWLYFASDDYFPFWRQFFLGTVLAMLLYVKVSLVLLFFPITFFMLLFWKRLSIQASMVLLAPIVLLELLFVSILGENVLVRLSSGIPLNLQRSEYQLGFMVKSVAVGGLWIVICGLLAFFFGSLRRKGSPLTLPVFLCSSVAILYIGFITYIPEEWNSFLLIFTAVTIGYNLGLLGIGVMKSKFWLGILLLLPFLLHFGSNIYWLRIGIHYWVFWILALLISWDKIRIDASLATAVFSIFFVFNGVWWHPYRQERPLWTEKVPWEISGIGALYLNPELVDILDKLNAGLTGSRDTPILAAYRIPGIVWLSGRQIPGSPGFWDKSQLDAFFENKPDRMIYNNLEELPADWSFLYRRELGDFQGDKLQLLWD